MRDLMAVLAKRLMEAGEKLAMDLELECTGELEKLSCIDRVLAFFQQALESDGLIPSWFEARATPIMMDHGLPAFLYESPEFMAVFIDGGMRHLYLSREDWLAYILEEDEEDYEYDEEAASEFIDLLMKMRKQDLGFSGSSGGDEEPPS